MEAPRETVFSLSVSEIMNFPLKFKASATTSSVQGTDIALHVAAYTGIKRKNVALLSSHTAGSKHCLVTTYSL